MRTAEFDRAYVLEQAMQLFRAHGYARTTMQALVAATGLHPGSIYAAFGNKLGLLEAVIEHYVADKQTQRQQMLQQPSALVGLTTYLDYIWQQGQAGTCLVMRSMIELSGEGEAQCRMLARMSGEMASDLQANLQRAIAQQELPAGADVEEMTAYLLLVIRGLTSQSSCGDSAQVPASVIKRVVDALRLGASDTNG